LFDEPTNGLDIPSKSQFRKVMLQAMTDETCVVISTHQVRDLHNLIDSVLILDDTNVLINADGLEICNKLYFGTSNNVQSNDKLLYSEDSAAGLQFIKENTENEESELNIELLFNAALSNKTRIRELFPQIDNRKGEENGI
jgi:ABC-2 type transport system ATP-binding protein